jgi:hypothetical protein
MYKNAKQLVSRKWLLALLISVVLPASFVVAQCKSYKLSDRGDTLNCVDMQGLRQGPWIVRIEPVRLDPGREEEGYYIDGKKDGIWRNYNLQGDVISVERYKWGMLNGKSQYYSVLGLEREESWLAINPTKAYDTFEVPDLYDPTLYRNVVVKNEGRSLRHGTWTYYDPTTGFVSKSEEFIRDSASNPLAMFGVGLSKNKRLPADTAKQGKKSEKPSVVQDWEKKNSGKKKVEVRDGNTGY